MDEFKLMEEKQSKKQTYYPDWAWEMLGKFAAEVAHMFLLHLNVADYVYDSVENKYISLKRFLIKRLLQNYKLVIFYDCSGGIKFASEEMRKEFMKIAAAKQWLNPKNPVLPKDADEALPLLEKFLEMTLEETRDTLKDYSPGESELSDKKDKFFTACVIGFTEAIAPAGDLGVQGHADRSNVITLARWARRSKIEDSGNVIIAMTNNQSAVSGLLKTATSSVETIKISLPTREQRLHFVRWLKKAYPKLKTELSDEALANITAGLARTSIEDLVKRAVHAGRELDSEYIWDLKKKIIEAESGGLVEVMNPRWGFEVVGGLDYIKVYLEKIVRAVKEGDLLRVPMGVLMIGPPGTGKTIVAEALAKRLGFAMLKLKNIREKWVGQSERNQDLVFELIRALAPVIVFEDEVDQKGFIRGEGFSGDSGVSQRLFANQLAFMSDTNLRGQVIWLSATNRPDLMDPALLREGRYDAKIPFLPPDKTEQVAIFKAIFQKMASKAEENNRKIVFKVTERELKRICSKEENLNGAEIEVILARAYDISADKKSKTVTAEDIEEAKADFIPSKDERLYEIGIDLALQQVNFMSFIPEKWRERARNIKDLPKRLKELREAESGGLTR